MNGVTVLLILLPLTAAFALIQRRRLYAVLGMSVFSLLLAAVYLLAAAPDVAITEAAIGAALGTFVYVLSIRKAGRLVVAASEVPGLLQAEGEGIAGLEWEILDRVARGLGLDLVVQLLPHEDVQAALLRGEADVGAGGLIESEANREVLVTPSFLATTRYVVQGPGQGARAAEPHSFHGYLSDVIASVRRNETINVRLDLARFLALTRHGLGGYSTVRQPVDLAYAFFVAPAKGEIWRRLSAEVGTMRESGELDDMIRRHLA